MGTIPPSGHIPQAPSQMLEEKVPAVEGTAVNMAFYSRNPLRLKQASLGGENK